MKKRGYTHVKELVPAIQQMVAEWKTQQEIAEYYGFRDKEVGFLYCLNKLGQFSLTKCTFLGIKCKMPSLGKHSAF